MKRADILIAAMVLMIVMLIILPIPTGLLDILLVVNITMSVFILLTSLFIKEALDFSAFPTMLLIVTLFRLSLNVSSTKLILGNDGQAGSVIETFGKFVIGENLVVGLIIFLVIIAIQFIVITKGSERVSEVAARFTLDAMPGKQMAIDADLNTGVIDEIMAKSRRENIQREADFYGAMDGASKFVKGDAILGIVITIINIVGGLVLGMLTSGRSIEDVVSVYTLATVGDGLVSQIPALLISTATGIVVTRSASSGSFGSEISGQMFGQPHVMILCGIIVFALALVPGFPKIPMFMLGGLLIVVGALSIRRQKKTEVEDTEDQLQAAAQEKRKPENVAALLQIEPTEVEMGYGIIPMVDANLGGDLLERVVMIRRQLAVELGMIIPTIRLRDNLQISPNEYLIKIKGVEVARGEVLPDHFLALNVSGADETIFGVETVDPTYGMPALWVSKNERERAELLGYTTIDPPSVIATHLTEIIKRYGHELMNRQQVQTLLDSLRAQQPALVDEVVPKMFSLGELQKVLANLLREYVPIRDMATIVETMSDYGHITHDTDQLTEFVRQKLRRMISHRFITESTASIVTLDPRLEQLILERTKKTETSMDVVVEPAQLQRIFVNLKNAVEKLVMQGKTPVVITSPMIRRQFKYMTEQVAPNLTVLSYSEIDPTMEIHSEGIVGL